MYQMYKLFIGMLMVLSSDLVFGETWKCNVENEREIYSKVDYVRADDHFESYRNGSKIIGDDEIILENDKEIILYYKDSTQSFITILEKKYKTITTYGSTGKDPNKDIPPGFGNCEISE